ncbi:hypothetical protein Tco_0559132 [Tanacetum coccineum]
MSSLKALIKQHNKKSGILIELIHLTFGDKEESDKAKTNDKRTEEEKDEDLQNPYKEVLKSSFTKRIIGFSTPNHRMPLNLKIYDGSTDLDDHVTRFMGATNQGEWQMPVWCRMLQQTLDGLARGWFDRLPNGCMDNLTDLQEKFAKRFALRRKCCKDLIRSEYAIHNHYCEEEEEGIYGPKFTEAYGASHINHTIPLKKKESGSFTLPCFINNVCFDNALVDP